MQKFHHPRSPKQLLTLGVISLIVLAGAAALGGFLAGALSASRSRKPHITEEIIHTATNIPATPGLGATSMPTPTPLRPTSTPAFQPSPTLELTEVVQITPSSTEITISITVTPTLLPETFHEGPIWITTSIQGRPLNAYRFGTGSSARALIGAIHGGYEWNTATLLTRTMTLLQDNPDWVPSDVTLYVIPNMNPDGYAAGTDAVVARMNANLVDLNRNWDYQWQMTATHGTRPVKAGTHPFSEPETRGIRDFIFDKEIEAVIFYHSALGVVFHGANTESSLTYPLTKMLSDATGYPIQTGIPGQITTGDAIDYFSEVGIAGTEIELTTHAEVNDAEFQRNIDGIKAFLQWKPEATISVTPERPIQTSEWITYVVKLGDSLLGLAIEYGTTVEELQYVNSISDPDELRIGDEILVPATIE